MENVHLATRVTSYTLVYFSDKNYPISRGNCFSVSVDENKGFDIVNFGLENLEELIKRGLKWPIKVKELSGSVAVIHDERIPDNWYSNRFCEVCCPKELLPINQCLTHERQIARGERKESSKSIVYDWTKRVTWHEIPPLEN